MMEQFSLIIGVITVIITLRILIGVETTTMTSSNQMKCAALVMEENGSFLEKKVMKNQMKKKKCASTLTLILMEMFLPITGVMDVNNTIITQAGAVNTTMMSSNQMKCVVFAMVVETELNLSLLL